MNENLDLTKILKDCPKGTKFYSPVYGKIEFIGIETFASNPDPIIIKWFKDENTTYLEYLRADGTFRGLGECTLFPSKDQRDWSKWHIPFKDGDVITCTNSVCSFVAIFKETNTDITFTRYVSLTLDDEQQFCTKEGWADFKKPRFATKEEKQKLFDAIKANGYKWNAETKTLEKLKKEKFDPKTLHPFDKVLVNSNGEWFCDFFSHYDDSVNQFNCTCTGGCPYDYCVPYNDDTKHLVGTNNEAPEYYKYWED